MPHSSSTSGWWHRLGTDDHDAAWTEFLEEFGTLLLQVARDVERDPDAAGETFLFICEGLADRQAARLRRFDPAGPARFETWLRAVSCNLALDARRRRRGRFRPLAAIRRLPVLEQHVFRLRYDEGLSLDDSLPRLRLEYPGLTRDRMREADRAVTRVLTSRHHWLLSTRRPPEVAIEELLADNAGEVPTVLDPGGDPEEALAAGELRARLEAALAQLTPGDRLLLDLRFEQGLTLERVAVMCGLKDKWAANRRIRDVLARVRAGLTAPRRDGSV